MEYQSLFHQFEHSSWVSQTRQTTTYSTGGPSCLSPVSNLPGKRQSKCSCNFRTANHCLVRKSCCRASAAHVVLLRGTGLSWHWHPPLRATPTNGKPQARKQNNFRAVFHRTGGFWAMTHECDRVEGNRRLICT